MIGQKRPPTKSQRTYGKGFRAAGGRAASTIKSAVAGAGGSSSTSARLRPALPTPATALPSPGADWSGYWTLITAMALVMFVVYLAANGLLTQWLDLLIYSQPATVSASGTSASSGSTSSPASAGTTAAQTAAQAIQSGDPLGAASAIGSYFLNPFEW